MLKSRFVRHGAVVLFYFLLAIIITYPLILNFSSVFAGFEYSDAYEDARHIWWFTYALRQGQSLFFQPLLAYPHGMEGVTLQANLLQYFPAWLFAFVMPLPAAHNLHMLLTMALNGWAMYLLAHALIGKRRPALIAGVIFMAFPTMQGHLAAAHSGLIVQWPFALYGLALLRLESLPERRWQPGSLLFTTVCFVLAALGHTLQIVWALLPLTVFFAIRWGVRRCWNALRHMIIACVLALFVLGLYLLPAFSSAVTYADEGGSVRYSADLLAPFTPSFFHPLYGQMEYTHRVLGINIDEGAAFVGIIGGMLAAIGLWHFRQARGWLVLALVAYGLSLGPLLKVFDQPVSFGVDGYSSHIVLPWALLQDLPIFNLVRTPGRFNFVLALCIAVLAGWGASWLLERYVRNQNFRWTATLVGIGLILFDYQTFFPLPTTSAEIPAAITELRDREDVRAVMDVPWDNLVSAKSGLYLQTAHQHPLIAGQVTRRTPVSPALLTILETTLDPALLNEAGVDVIIVHKQQLDDGALSQLEQHLGAPGFEDDRFALFETPSSQADPAFTSTLSTQSVVNSQADSYVFAPAAGWALLETTLNADGRDIRIRLNGETLASGFLDDATQMHIPLPFPDAGFYTISLDVEPPCQPQIAPGEICRSLQVESLEIGNFVAGDFAAPILFEGGITLAGHLIATRTDQERSVQVWLWWEFAEARTENDIRFVHLLDGTGTLMAQQDVPLGMIPADSTRSEEVIIPLPDDLAPGEYQVIAGWYTYPEIAPFHALNDDGRAGDVSLGSFTLAEAAPSLSD